MLHRLTRFLHLKHFVWTALLLYLCDLQPARAEYIPTFAMAPLVNRAELIVQGDLDPAGQLKVSSTYKGQTEARLQIQEGAALYTMLSEAEKRAGEKSEGDLPVVAFVSRSEGKRGTLGVEPLWHLTFPKAGLVGLAPDGIFLYGEAYASDSPLAIRLGDYTYGLKPNLNQETFFQNLNQALGTSRHFNQLLSLPRSAEHLRQLLDFLSWQEDYYWTATGDALRAVHPDEERIILDALQSHSTVGRARPIPPNSAGQHGVGKNGVGQNGVGQNGVGQNVTQQKVGEERLVALLWLLNRIQPSARAFRVVEPFAKPNYSAPVRTAAVACLADIDHEQFVERVFTKLSVDDPDIAMMISFIGTISSPDREGFHNPEAVRTVLRLSQALRQQPLAVQNDRMNDIGNLIIWLQDFGQPLALRELHQWTLGPQKSAREDALRALNALTGLDFTSQQAWEAWWQKQGPLLTVSYDLHTSRGRHAWMLAYHQADPAARRVLIRLWFLERTIDEQALLEDASSGGYVSDSAKSVLAELWYRKRLSPQTHHAIVAHFLPLALVQLPEFWDKYGHLEFQIVAQRNFPFPENSWMTFGDSIAVGNEKIALDPPDNQRSLEGSGPLVLGSRGGGILEGPPVARAEFVMQEVDHYSYTDGPKVLWSQKWSLAPLQMLPASRARSVKVEPQN